MQLSNTYPYVIDTPHGPITIDLKKVVASDISGDMELWFYGRSATENAANYEVAVIEQSKADSIDVMRTYSQVLLFAFPITIVLAGLMIYVLANKLLKPVEDITRVARRIGDNDLESRIPVRNNDELGILSRTLNQTFDRLQREFNKERQFAADASHGLKAPLAIMQGEATLALNKSRKSREYRKSLELISQDIGRMSSLVQKILVLTRSDGDRRQANFVKINLQELLNDIAADMQVICEAKNINLKQNLEPSVMVKGDELRLRELFMNLLDNAVRYTPAGGAIAISLSGINHTAYIDIKDTGIGIRQEHIPYIMERFYKVDKTHSRGDGGAGLGLAICKNIAEHHGGKITVESEVGVGSLFTVTLPSITNASGD
jgi:signal transduction histidine kinase